MTFTALMSTLIIVFIGVAAYANPVVLFFIWVGRLRGTAKPSLQVRLGWASLVLASAGFGIALCFATCGPPAATDAFDLWFRHCFWVSVGVCLLTLVTGLAGKGKMQWFVPLSGVIGPLSIVLGKVLE
jgi:hypothetical protein